MRICYFGGFDPAYTRNNFLRLALEKAGHTVVLCRVPPEMPTVRKIPALVRQYARVRRACDVIVVAEFQQTTVPLAWGLARLTGKPLAFDFLISLYEAVIEERQRFAPGSLQARRRRWADAISVRLPDRVIVPTQAYADFLHDIYHVPPEKVSVVPLGVNDEIFSPLPGETPDTPPLTVLYYGSYIPNHGIDVILEAIEQLKGDERFRFRFVGDGENKPAAVETAERLGLPIEFVPRVPFEKVPGVIAGADIVLGVFGKTPQADKSLANKTLEPLSMRKPVIAGDTRALREHFTHGEHLYLTPLGDSGALAEGLRALAADPALRKRLAESGYARVRDQLSLEVIGEGFANNLHALIP